MQMLEVDNISKTYKNLIAIDNISFSINKGEFVGLLGANGAGKSTLMKAIATLLTPDSGSIKYQGQKCDSSNFEYKNKLGYLSEENPLYDFMYVNEYLNFIRDIYNADKKHLHYLIDVLELQPELAKKIKTLSKGNRQRVGIVQTLMHKPEVIVMDEATTGLDLEQRETFMSLLYELSKDSVILFSTHILQEVEKYCTRFILIDKGRLIADASLGSITSIEERFRDMK